MPGTVMLIHGAWLTPASWDLVRARYEARGYACVAPPWPHMDRPVAELRRAPDPAFAKLTVGKIVAHYEQLIRARPEPPILIGHSFGGLFVQMLLDRGLGAAGVAVDPASPRGILVTPTALRTALPIFLAWRGWSRALTMTFEQFSSGFAQTLPESEKRSAYDRHIVPAPGRIFYQAAFGAGTGVKFSNAARAPLLLIAGELDRTVPIAMVRSNFRKLARSGAVTELETFPGRSHFLLGEPGWEEVADYAIEWATARTRPRGVAAEGALPQRASRRTSQGA